MFKGIANFASMLKQASEMQGKIGEIQDELSKLRVEGAAGAGLVTVTASGQQVVTACHVDPSLLESGDREMLEDLIVTATNQALSKAKDLAAQKLAGQMNIPGLAEGLQKFGLGGGT